MELIIQKAVELGVYEVVPVVTKRAVVKLDAKKSCQEGCALECNRRRAAKQSGRNRIPEVHDVMTFAEALEFAKA